MALRGRDISPLGCPLITTPFLIGELGLDAELVAFPAQDVRVELAEIAVTGGNPLNTVPIDKCKVVGVVETEKVELVGGPV